MSFQYKAYLLADFRFSGSKRTPVLHGFVVRSEHHGQITTDWKRGFYATVLSAASAENYQSALIALNHQVKLMLPSVYRFVKW